MSDDSGMTDTGYTILIVIITSAVTFVLTATIYTAIVTFMFVRKAPKKVNDAKHPDDPPPQQQTSYDHLLPSSHTITEDEHLELQPNPAYDLNHKEIMDTHSTPVYESCY